MDSRIINSHPKIGAHNKKEERKGGLMAIKLDMHKAYDCMEWEFILSVIKVNGFKEHVCRLFMACITLISYLVLLNGLPLSKNFPKRVLSKLIQKEQDVGSIHWILIPRNAPSISRLMIVDDTILFIRANEKDAQVLMKCIKRMKKEDYKALKDKLLKRLEGWKLRLMSYARCTTLVKSVSLRIPIYNMSACRVPLSMCTEMDAVIKKLWWTGSLENDKFRASKNWDSLYQPKAAGRLGSRRFEDILKALLAKLAWSVAKGDHKHWINCLTKK
ncbi:uncharacterized protein LOC133779855 [Humulus lupulus]|uniref:uncharacterized protein LOC133779855 n=1 Tax=Humulus lupulus TaxID=3486 RepID=UPI002B410043|nr:uncharacterized protein LOC133779855 [Humulus lupulus]